MEKIIRELDKQKILEEIKADYCDGLAYGDIQALIEAVVDHAMVIFSYWLDYAMDENTWARESARVTDHINTYVLGYTSGLLNTIGNQKGKTNEKVLRAITNT